MKRLISLISSEEKTREQIVKETWDAFQKYKQVEAEELKKADNEKELKDTNKSSEL